MVPSVVVVPVVVFPAVVVFSVGAEQAAVDKIRALTSVEAIRLFNLFIKMHPP
jgi:hypothetical protein